MKTLLMTAVLALAPMMMSAQEKPVKTAEQVMAEVTDLSNKHATERVERYAGYFRESTAKFKTLAEERTNRYKELDEALVDGDPVLVKKAVSDIHANAYAIKVHGESQKSTGDSLLGYLADNLGSDLLTRTRYIELRDMVRAGIAETNAKLPEEYVKLAVKAKTVIPDYFAMLERIDRSFGQ